MTDQATGHPGQVQGLFDEKAATWSAKYAPHGPLVPRLTELAAAVTFHAPIHGRVLDLGCGTGELARHLAATGLRVVGSDISAEMLARAAPADRDRTVAWVQLEPAWQLLPFTAASFDVVVAASVLEYVRSPADVFGEAAKLLRPGGAMLCTVPDLAHPVRWAESLASIGARLPGVPALGHRSPRFGGYLTYLRISQNRHTAGWWWATAARSGLLTMPTTAGALRSSPLRLLRLQRPILGKGQAS